MRPETVFLGLYGHIIDMALKKYLRLLPPELCSPAFQDVARNALTEKLRAQHSVSPLPLCIKGNYRSQQIAEQLADDFTAEEHLAGPRRRHAASNFFDSHSTTEP